MAVTLYTVTNFYAHCKDWIIMKTLAELIALNLKPEYLFQHCLDTATDYCDEVGDTHLFMFNDGSKLRTVRNGALTEVVK